MEGDAVTPEMVAEADEMPGQVWIWEGSVCRLFDERTGTFVMTLEEAVAVEAAVGGATIVPEPIFGFVENKKPRPGVVKKSPQERASILKRFAARGRR